jgi:hypothetical protein
MRFTREALFRIGQNLAVICSVCAVVLSYGPSSARANNATVLGVRSVEGDDAYANALSSALRSEASKVAGWKVSEKAVSLTQMGLAYGCDEPDIKCLSDIAAGIDTDILIYGTIRRTGVGEHYNFSVILSLFIRSSSAIENTVVEPAVTPELDADALSSVSVRLLNKLMATPSAKGLGSVLLRTNLMDSRVELDGQFVGNTSEGELLISDVAIGKHKLEILQEGYERFIREITVPEGGQVAVQGTLLPNESKPDAPAQPSDAARSHTSLTWLGFTLLGVGAASVGGMILSWAIIKDVDEDEVFTEYRTRAGEINGTAVNDVCTQAKNGISYAQEGDNADEIIRQVTDMCDRASLFETLQYVFLGTAVVSTALGTFVLIREAGRPEKSSDSGAAKVTLALWPTFSANTGRIYAKLTF